MEDWLEKLCEKYGNDFSWPPYPRELVYPDFIKNYWINWKFCGRTQKILKIGHEIRSINIGDQFNAIIVPKKRGVGLKKSKTSHRVFQMIPKLKRKGYIVYRDSISGAETLKEGEIMKERVHRLEIVAINHKRGTYDCVALAHTFNKDKLLENLICCNYQR